MDSSDECHLCWALGEKFDLRQFCNLVLRNGSMPRSLLEQVVDDSLLVSGAS